MWPIQTNSLQYREYGIKQLGKYCCIPKKANLNTIVIYGNGIRIIIQLIHDKQHIPVYPTYTYIQTLMRNMAGR